MGSDGKLLPAPRPDLPVLLIVGADDPTSNRGALEVTRKLIPQVQIDLIEGAGHWVQQEQAGEVVKQIKRFLEKYK